MELDAIFKELENKLAGMMDELEPVPCDAPVADCEVIAFDGTEKDNTRWKALMEEHLQTAATFEIHCWSDETAEIMAALRYGQKVKTSWSGGTVIRGRITREFLSFLTEAKKPTDTEIYNKMTPFFTIVFGDTLHSEHYGTEIIISKVIREKQPAVDRILDQMSEIGTVHRNIG